MLKFDPDRMRKYRKKTAKKAIQGDYETAFRKQEQQWYTVFFTKLNTPVTFWLCFFLILFFYLQKQLVYHFYYIEQEQLFLWSRAYFSSLLMEPAGLVRYLTEFCVQYFIHPYCGSLIMSALFTCIGMLTAGIIKRISPTANLFLLSILPIILLLYIHFDVNYSYRGTMAYLLMLLVLYGYFFITRTLFRLTYVTIFGVLLFWWAGAVAFLFVICIFLWELLNHFSRAYSFILPLLLVTGLAFGAIYTSMAGDYRFLFLPDGYFTNRLRPGMVIYFSWIFLPFLLILCRFLRKKHDVNGGRKYIEIMIQFLIVMVIFYYGMGKFANRNSDFYKELDYYMRTEQWDKIIERSNGDIKNYLYKCCLNVALAEKGELAERMFSFDQQGLQSIYIYWNRIPHVSVLLTDIYFSMGHIAMAQRMAFEANESMPNAGGTRMLKRLVQTNLIYGTYSIAEKYIDLLEQTMYYKDWAREHRRFLWNSEAIVNDSLLNVKRMCILHSNMMSELQGLYFDLEYIAEQNPSHQASIQYAGAIYLLSKDLTLFQEFLEKHYGTDTLPVLPKSFQEAALILYEQDPSFWEQYAISTSVVLRFNEFRRQVSANRGNTAALPDLMRKSFGDTYWFYYMFK